MITWPNQFLNRSNALADSANYYDQPLQSAMQALSSHEVFIAAHYNILQRWLQWGNKMKKNNFQLQEFKMKLSKTTLSNSHLCLQWRAWKRLILSQLWKNKLALSVKLKITSNSWLWNAISICLTPSRCSTWRVEGI